PFGDFADQSNGGLAEIGYSANVTGGYLFSDHFGIATTWFTAENTINTDNINGVNSVESWSYDGFMVGSLFSFQVSEKVDWNFKLMLGVSFVTFPDFGKGTEQAASVANSVGTQLRIHVSNRVSLLFNAETF